MPMTLAHPAAVLPLGSLGLPMTALVVGSMVPDLPLFMGWPRGYDVTHSLFGILTVDIVLTLAVLLLWFVAFRDPIVDMAPQRARLRLPERARLTNRQWLLAPLAACAGAATHVLWDEFTHPGRWGARHLAWLSTEHAGLRGTAWLQHASGVLGLAVVVVAAVHHLRTLPPTEPIVRPSAVLSPGVLPGVVMLSAVAGLVTAALERANGFHTMAFFGVVNSLIAAAALGALACALWHLARWREGPNGRLDVQLADRNGSLD